MVRDSEEVMAQMVPGVFPSQADHRLHLHSDPTFWRGVGEDASV